MNNKNILLAAAVLVAGQTYGAQPANDLTTFAGVRAHVIGQRVQAENNAVQQLQSAELVRRNNLTTFSRVVEDAINPITACGSMLYGGIKNIGFYSYHFLKYPLVSLGLVAAGRSVGTALHKEITDETFNKVLLCGATAGAIFSICQAPKDIANLKKLKDLQEKNSILETDFNAAVQLAATHGNTHGSLQVIQQELADQTAALNNIKEEQERTAGAIKVAALELDVVRGQLHVNSRQLAGIEDKSLLLIKGQFVTALHGLLNSVSNLYNSYMAIQGLSQRDNIREMSIQMFAQNLTVLNGLAEQAMRTLEELKNQYPELYKELQSQNIGSITTPLTTSLQLLNQSGAPYLALGQAPVVQQALENRVEREAQLLSLTSSSSSTTTNIVPNVPIVSEELALRETQSPSLNMNSDSRLSLLAAPSRSILPVHCPSLMNSNNLLPLPAPSNSTSFLESLNDVDDGTNS